MEKIIKLTDEKLFDEFLSVFSIGLLECLKKDMISTERAESWLFSPVTALSCINLSEKKQMGCQITQALEYASELDACKKVCNDEEYQKSIYEAIGKFEEVLKNSVRRNPANEESDCMDIFVD